MNHGVVRLLSTSAAIYVAIAFLSCAAAQTSGRPEVVPNHGSPVTEGLVIAGWDYFQSAWRLDPVEGMMVQGAWSPPSAGTEIDSAHTWRPVQADSEGWITHPDLRGGYLYAEVKSESDRVVILEGLGYRQVLINGEPRTGNVYGFKEDWEPWEPPFDFSFVPVKLRAGSNELLFEGGRARRMKAIIHTPDAPFMINARDATLPDLIVGDTADYWASVAVINATESTARGLRLSATVGDGSPVRMDIPDFPPLSVRKMGFRIEAPAPEETGAVTLQLAILDPRSDEPLDVASIDLTVREPRDNHRRTFVSSIDGSVQYFGLNPARDGDHVDSEALVLSVHGAAVEAINQSASYRAKPWAHIVAPTNRRPYGFNWEDWGRLDALEVLDIARSTLNVDPRRVYLTGHSMGGHGTWHLGALYPDRFAAIGPSAGWISFWSYRPRGEIELRSPTQRMLMRATLPSRTMDLATNYSDLGVYIIHGADDDNVPAEQSRMMVERLSGFHRDFVYHEEPDAGHWWDKSDEDGADCVDWPALFDFFSRHARPEAAEVREVDFITPNPGVSSCYQWVCILQQIRPLEMSRVNLRFDPGRRRFVGGTNNVERLRLAVPQGGTDSVSVMLDGQHLRLASDGTVWLHRAGDAWMESTEPPPSGKGPHRNGTFKDAFRNHMLLVYGTGGSSAENKWALVKARWDAEQFWYQGNGGVDVLPDTLFDPAGFPDRNVVLYGNRDTNGAWEHLLGDSPVRVARGRVEVGTRSMTGDSLGVLLIRPRTDSDVASVGAVAGTGLAGMSITTLRPYLSAGFAYPDVVVFDAGRPGGSETVIGAGFFGNDWSVDSGEFVWAAD